MSVTDILALALSAIAIIVTITLYVTTRVNAVATRRAADRTRVVDLVVAATERSVRSFGRPGILRLWGSPEIDTALVVPRLIAQLGPRHRGVQRWVTLQVAKQLHEADRVRALEVQTTMAFQLLAWDRGLVDDAWFGSQVDQGRKQLSLAVPVSVRRAKVRRLSVQVFAEAVGVSVLVAMLGKVWRLL